MVETSISLAVAETLADNMTVTTPQVVILSIHGYFGQTGAFMYPPSWLVNSPTCVCAYVASTIEGSLIKPAGALCRGARPARHRRAGRLHPRSGGVWSVVHENKRLNMLHKVWERRASHGRHTWKTSTVGACQTSANTVENWVINSMYQCTRVFL